MSTNDPTRKDEIDIPENATETAVYTAPGIEDVMTPNDLEREVLYAGSISPIML